MYLDTNESCDANVMIEDIYSLFLYYTSTSMSIFAIASVIIKFLP